MYMSAIFFFFFETSWPTHQAQSWRWPARPAGQLLHGCHEHTGSISKSFVISVCFLLGFFYISGCGKTRTLNKLLESLRRAFTRWDTDHGSTWRETVESHVRRDADIAVKNDITVSDCIFTDMVRLLYASTPCIFTSMESRLCLAYVLVFTDM